MSASASLTILGAPELLEPGQQTLLTAEIINRAYDPDDFRLSVRGIDPAWVVFRPPALQLKPGERGTAQILVSPPADAPAQSMAPVFRLLSRRAGVVIAEAGLWSEPEIMPESLLVTGTLNRLSVSLPAGTPLPPAPTLSQRLELDWFRPRRRGNAPPRDNWLSVALVILLALLIFGAALGVTGYVLIQRDRALPPTAIPTRATTSVPTATVPVPIAVPPTALLVPPTPIPSAAPFVGKNFVVAETGGQGVFLRRTPNLTDRDTAYPDNTRLVQIGPDVEAGGMTWRNVRTPDGKVGFIPAQYTREVP